MRKGERELVEMFDKERQRWQEERRELLNRIQHPEIRPVTTRDDYQDAIPPQDQEEWDWVGKEVPGYVQVGTPNSEE